MLKLVLSSLVIFHICENHQVLVGAVPPDYYAKPDTDTWGDINERINSDDSASVSARAASASTTGTNFGKYFLSNIPVDWSSARTYCQGFTEPSMRLLAILSSDDNSEIVGLLDSLGVNQVWTSGYDGSVDGSYSWASAGIPFVYSNWIRGNAPKSPSNNCVFLGTNSYFRNEGRSGWDILSCETGLRFVCERV